ncbi:MAG: type II toxin-antitoxin system RelB/DinJ family antitoxin [Candidatus Competibacteraceae bacterium]|nr:type II toxin-antitoxin system RelB/DinJ family antitoxin [Candidatus Competibacteraceae bacterium]
MNRAVEPREATVRARIEADIKQEAEEVLKTLGMSMSDAIRLLVHQIALRRGFPLELTIPAPRTGEDAPPPQSLD